MPRIQMIHGNCYNDIIKRMLRKGERHNLVFEQSCNAKTDNYTFSVFSYALPERENCVHKTLLSRIKCVLTTCYVN